MLSTSRRKHKGEKKVLLEQRNFRWIENYRLTSMHNNNTASVNYNLYFLVCSFTELAPKLISNSNVKYLLSEVFSQDPLERYFSRQRHRGGSNSNPTAHQVPYNAALLVQQQSMYRDLKSMNIEAADHCNMEDVSQPLPKRPRRKK